MLDLWGVTPDGEPQHSPDGTVLFGERHGEPVAIKMLGQDFDSSGAGAASRLFSEKGGIKVLDSADGSLLLERATPGTSLKEALFKNPAMDDTAIFCDTALKLHGSSRAKDSIPPLFDWCSSLKTPAPDVINQLGEETLSKASRLFSALWNSQTTTTALHGDLHHDNIILDQKKGWLAIDPKGVVGDPALEAAAFLRNPLEQTEKITKADVLSERIQTIADRTGWEKHRIISWAYCQNVLSAVWDIQSQYNPTAAILLFRALEPDL